MGTQSGDLTAFMAVAPPADFARAPAQPAAASGLSEAVRRLSSQRGVTPAQPHHPQRGAHRGPWRGRLERLGPRWASRGGVLDG